MRTIMAVLIVVSAAEQALHTSVQLSLFGVDLLVWIAGYLAQFQHAHTQFPIWRDTVKNIVYSFEILIISTRMKFAGIFAYGWSFYF